MMAFILLSWPLLQFILWTQNKPFNISLKCIKYKHTVLCYIMHLQVDIQMWETSVFMKEWPSYPTGGSPVYAILQHFYFIYVPYENRTFISSSLTNVLSTREGTRPSVYSLGGWHRHLPQRPRNAISSCAYAHSFAPCSSEICLALSKLRD